MEQHSQLHSCCKVESNLIEQESGKEDLVLLICKICNRRHFELTIDPGHIGVKIASTAGN